MTEEQSKSVQHRMAARQRHTKLELRFHHAMPGWCQIVGLVIKDVPECEGAGHKIPEDQARFVVAATDACDEAGITNRALEDGVLQEVLNAAEAVVRRSQPHRFVILRGALAKLKGEEKP